MPSPALRPPDAPNLRTGERVTYALGNPMSSTPLSLQAVFTELEGPLLGFALGLVGQRMVAEELVQDAFLLLHPRWAEVENPRAWLYRCVRNLALNHLRDHRRETNLPEGTIEAVPAPEDLPVEAMGRNEAEGMVRLFLAELPPEDRELIHLKYHEELKYQEISQRTGLNAGTVGYKLHHLLKTLAETLRSAGIESSQG